MMANIKFQNNMENHSPIDSTIVELKKKLDF